LDPNAGMDIMFLAKRAGIKSLLYKPGKWTLGSEFKDPWPVQETGLIKLFGENWKDVNLRELTKKYGVKGFKLEGARIEISHGGLTIQGELYRGGENIGSFRRQLDFNKIAYHSEFWIAPHLTGKGIAKSHMKSLVELYDEIGVKTIKCNANGQQGKYAWAKYGYDFESKITLEQMKRYFRSQAKLADYKTSANYKAAIIEIDSFKHSWNFANYTFRGQKWGKEWMLGSDMPSWRAVLDLTKGSTGRNILEKYVGGV